MDCSSTCLFSFGTCPSSEASSWFSPTRLLRTKSSLRACRPYLRQTAGNSRSRRNDLSLTSSFQLAGRILLIFLFIGFIFQGNWSFARVLVSIVGLGACIMVAVGFKAKYSASFLVALLSIFNVFINNWSALALVLGPAAETQVVGASCPPTTRLFEIRLLPNAM